MMDKILQWNLPPSAQSVVNVVLIWIGFAMVVGLLARVFIPSKMTKSPLITLLVGLSGCCIGPLVLSCYYPIDEFNPIGLLGFLSSLAAAIGVLFLFHFFMLFCPARSKKTEDDAENDSSDKH